MGQSIQERGQHPVKFCKGCLLQILLGPFLNTLSHVTVMIITHFE